MEQNTETILAVDSKNVSVHLHYLRKDMDELKLNQKLQFELMMKKLDEMKSEYPTRREMEELRADNDKSHLILQKTDEDHEERMRSVEKLIWKASGVAALGGVVAGLIVQIIFK